MLSLFSDYYIVVLIQSELFAIIYLNAGKRDARRDAWRSRRNWKLPNIYGKISINEIDYEHNWRLKSDGNKANMLRNDKKKTTKTSSERCTRWAICPICTLCIYFLILENLVWTIPNAETQIMQIKSKSRVTTKKCDFKQMLTCKILMQTLSDRKMPTFFLCSTSIWNSFFFFRCWYCCCCCYWPLLLLLLLLNWCALRFQHLEYALLFAIFLYLFLTFFCCCSVHSGTAITKRH